MNKPLALNDFLEAAAYAVVGARCRQAHLHDLRGGLQALHSSVELLARAAKPACGNAALADKAGALARKTLGSHEKSLVELLDILTPNDESAAVVNLGDLMTGVIGFLRGDATRKSIVMHLQAASDISIVTLPHRCKVAVLGLCAMMIDEVPAGASVAITVGQCDSLAFIEWRPDLPLPALRSPTDWWYSAQTHLSPCELLLALAGHWTSVNGGRMELPGDTPGRNVIRVYYPAACTLVPRTGPASLIPTEG